MKAIYAPKIDKTYELIQDIGKFPAGATVNQILQLTENKRSKRTLQRHLEELVKSGRITTSGATRSRRYYARKKPFLSLPRGIVLEEDETVYRTKSDAFSAAALLLKAKMNKPLEQRLPVSYEGDFLRNYLPNQTFYLNADLRQELRKMGQVGMERLPAGTYLRQVINRLLIDLSWNSSRLEGNTYSLLETEILLERGEMAAGKETRETQMILNHKNAIEMLSDQAAEIGFNRYTICNLHALLAENLLPNPASGGSIRTSPVGIGGTVFVPLNVPQQIEEFFDLILAKAQAIEDPFEQSFFAMVHLPYLQPFEDVNKRVSRLASNIPLIKNNLCPLSFVDLSADDYVGAMLAIYELNDVTYLRDVFAMAYRKSCERYASVAQTLGEPDPFRLLNRVLIGDMVRSVVEQSFSKKQAAAWIAEEAKRTILHAEQSKLIQVVETELCSLHMGNIARYRLRPSQFDAWQMVWLAR